MRIAYMQPPGGQRRLGLVGEGAARLLASDPTAGVRSLADILHSDDPAGLAASLVNRSQAAMSLDSVALLAPVDRQEIWAAGVTYKRSQVARMEESESGASHYDKVYTADRPELFFKSQPHRVSGPGDPVRVRFDSDWSVPEPEFTLVISPAGKIVGYTIGNDVSAWDIERENALYLPQSKVYDACCALGPFLVTPDEIGNPYEIEISCTIRRRGKLTFEGKASVGQLRRKFEEMVEYLTRGNSVPTPTVLLTGTGIIVTQEAALAPGDVITIDVPGIGSLVNEAAKV